HMPPLDDFATSVATSHAPCPGCGRNVDKSTVRASGCSMTIRILCLCAGPCRDFGMPPYDVAILRRHREFCRLHEVDGDQSDYVGNGIICSEDERANLELAFEN